MGAPSSIENTRKVLGHRGPNRGFSWVTMTHDAPKTRGKSRLAGGPTALRIQWVTPVKVRLLSTALARYRHSPYSVFSHCPLRYSLSLSRPCFSSPTRASARNRARDDLPAAVLFQ